MNSWYSFFSSYNEMSFIEGIGDEVTAFFVFIIVVLFAFVVTFLGNGSNLYPLTPTHTVTVAVRPNANTDQALEASSDTLGHADQNHTFNPPEHPNILRQRQFTNAFNGLASLQERPESERSNGIEEASSSEEESRTEDNTEESKARTVPPEEASSQEDETSQQTSQQESGIRVRLKYLDDTERLVISDPTVRIAEFKRNHFHEELANNKVVRLIFSGHLLRDNSTLESYRIVNNSVVHVQILQAQANQPNMSANQIPDVDLSHLLVPVIVVALIFFWCMHFYFPEYFNPASFGILCVFSVSFAAVMYSSR